MIGIVSATRLSDADFWNKSALGISLRRHAHDKRLSVRVICENQHGLPFLYNHCIQEAAPDDQLVFLHDDIWIDDIFFADHLAEGLRHFDVVGIAGNRRRVPGQPAWAFTGISGGQLNWDDDAHLSGAVGQDKNPCGRIRSFGPLPAECELLDGCFIAANARALQDRGVLFDTRFDFHFYDMDFCRSAREQGLRLGTWPISLTHQSNGRFGTPEWSAKYQAYLAKWGS